MEIVLYLLGITLSVVGLALGGIARNYRTADAPPFPSWNPRHWKPIWKTRNWFTEPAGFRIFVAGSFLMSLGGCVLLISLLLY